ncbi:hypothetical protein O181_070369 [Austropuccinia psidii MF-1]|uniref:Glycosyl transferase CAP10 domain-containing protein n=1 Tax=Austropuccinia psidii MF-1 TaxID=1389203 RepID=A0A9Q3F0P2_9BASI|nr:hypothetical protein [Austropuccinia psidii MF-1]
MKFSLKDHLKSAQIHLPSVENRTYSLPPRFKSSTYFIFFIILVLVIFIDRSYFRYPDDTDCLSDRNFHLTNSIVSHTCNLISSQQNNSLSDNLNLSSCLRQLKSSHKSLKPLYNDHQRNLAMDRQLDSESCQRIFPRLYDELDRVKAYCFSKNGITLEQLDKGLSSSHARVLLYNNRLYVKHFNPAPWSRPIAILNSIHEAVITSPEPLPNIEFLINTDDAIKSDEPLPIWALDRVQSQEALWLMPDFGFYSWPEPKVGSMIEVRDKTAALEAKMTWKDKIPKAIWRGAPMVELRQQLLQVSNGQKWSDIASIDWSNPTDAFIPPEDHCQYKYLIHTEGSAYSGRLKYLQMCRSVIIAHQMNYIQHFHHLLDSRPHSETQNIALVDGPGFQGLPKLINSLIENDEWSETIANNSYSLFSHHLSPAGVNCYWRQMFNSWAQVQAFSPKLNKSDISFESFNLMHTVDWQIH